MEGAFPFLGVLWEIFQRDRWHGLNVFTVLPHTTSFQVIYGRDPSHLLAYEAGSSNVTFTSHSIYFKLFLIKLFNVPSKSVTSPI